MESVNIRLTELERLSEYENDKDDVDKLIHSYVKKIKMENNARIKFLNTILEILLLRRMRESDIDRNHVLCTKICSITEEINLIQDQINNKGIELGIWKK